MSKIHRIAVFISHIYGDYQRNLCQGVIDKAAEFGYRVDIFASNDEQILGQYALGESGILRIPTPSTYDGVIISSGTYLVPELREKVLSTLQEWHCPVIDINSVPSPFPNVLLDNNSPIKDMVTHLATIHSLKRIYYLGNAEEPYISNTRESYYVSAMTSLGLSSYIKTAGGGYSTAKIIQGLDELLQQDPQAIVCYNDATAISVMEELAIRGVDVPGQIAITGCDNLEFGQHISPALTTITFPTYELGQEAFIQLLEYLDHNAVHQNITVKATPKFGASCGCAAHSGQPAILYGNKLRKKNAFLESIYLHNMHMSSCLQGITDIDAAMDALFQLFQNLETDQGIDGLSEFYLCLYSDWEQISHQVRRLTLMEDTVEKDKVYLKLAIKNHERLPECTFSQNDSLPEFLRKKGTHMYIFTPLYFGNSSFGYLCQAFEDNKISYPFSFVSWLQMVGSMLQTIRDSKNMQLMVNRLEDIYSHDSLTGLLNLQSFQLLMPQYLKQAREQQKPITAIVLDLDRLKRINDQYGHAEGNFAIQVLGQAINQVCSDELAACRFGGDEFYLMGIGYTAEEAGGIILRIQKYLEHYNNNKKKPYQVTVSGGYSLTTDYTDDNLNETFKQADYNMYRQKEKKHAAEL